MRKATFRQRMIQRLDEALVDLDDEGSFSDYWSEVQEYVDDFVDHEDSEDQEGLVDEDDEDYDGDAPDLVE